MARSFASSRAPMAIVTESTAGIATGIAATVRMRANWTSSSADEPRASCTSTSTATSARLRAMR